MNQWQFRVKRVSDADPVAYTVMIPLSSSIIMHVTSLPFTVFKLEKSLKHYNHS